MKAKLLLWKYCYKSKSASNRWGERNLVAVVAISLLGGLPLPEQRLQPELGLIFSWPTWAPLIFLELGSPSSIPSGAGLSLKSLRMLARWPDDDEVAVAVSPAPLWAMSEIWTTVGRRNSSPPIRNDVLFVCNSVCYTALRMCSVYENGGIAGRHTRLTVKWI